MYYILSVCIVYWKYCSTDQYIHMCVYPRVGPLSGDQEATQIFIIYMHDIVLEISFLDLNDCPNLSPSNWKLLQKSVNI